MAMTKDTESKFRTQTEAGLVACGDYLRDHAAELADVFAGGCIDWSIEFHHHTADEWNFPQIDIRVNKLDRGIIAAYYED